MVKQRKIIFVLYLILNTGLLYSQYDSLKIETAIIKYKYLCESVEKRVRKKIIKEKEIWVNCPYPEKYSFIVLPTYCYEGNKYKSYFNNIDFGHSSVFYDIHMLYDNKYAYVLGSDPVSNFYYYSKYPNDSTGFDSRLVGFVQKFKPDIIFKLFNPTLVCLVKDYKFYIMDCCGKSDSTGFLVESYESYIQTHPNFEKQFLGLPWTQKKRHLENGSLWKTDVIF